MSVGAGVYCFEDAGGLGLMTHGDDDERADYFGSCCPAGMERACRVRVVVGAFPAFA